ncbi:MAG: arsenite methyltransferase [Phycisphaerales bacterium]|nr:arsenite methyltransferase [Phycisphaerales bacterium]
MKRMETDGKQTVIDQVRQGYAAIAEKGGSGCCGSSPCCDGADVNAGAVSITERIGYATNELDRLPDGADMGLSCGNPTALAALKPGEVVLDLGSGGGLDCFIAGPMVGRTGRVIGVDMTPQMISRARGGVGQYRERTGLDNVEFRLGEIEHLPAADAGVDVVISNCVLNLSPDKPQVWREIARVLKPGGRAAVSDLALLRPLPREVRAMMEALVGCIAGAALIDETRDMMRAAGLTDIRLTPKPGFIKTLGEMQDPLYRKIVENLPTGEQPADYITSLDIAARKPAPRS